MQARGTLYVGPGTKVYTGMLNYIILSFYYLFILNILGMIIGVASKEFDLDVNPVKEKHLSNVRTVMKEDTTKLQNPTVLTLEDALSLVKVLFLLFYLFLFFISPSSLSFVAFING